MLSECRKNYFLYFSSKGFCSVPVAWLHDVRKIRVDLELRISPISKIQGVNYLPRCLNI